MLEFLLHVLLFMIGVLMDLMACAEIIENEIEEAEAVAGATEEEQKKECKCGE
jgi:hypothetical protein